MIPYGRHSIDDQDIAKVVEILKSDWLTTGPAVNKFERAVAKFTGAEDAVAVSSGTAALHAAIHALGIGSGDEVIVPPMTFAATANSVVYAGANPVFTDVQADTLLIDPACVREKITPATKAVIAVDFAGQLCDYNELAKICKDHGIALVADCCHALGATDENGIKAGKIADISILSFHPVKHITTGEGGMALTDDELLSSRMRSFRNHGINLDAAQRSTECTWEYEMQDLGYNYRITDIQCALGLSQLGRLENFLEIREKLAHRYDSLFAENDQITPLSKKAKTARHAYHLYVVKIPASQRKRVFQEMRDKGIGVNVHYIPVHYHPYYKENFKTGKGLCPVAESEYEKILTLPLHQGMSNADVDFIATTLAQMLR